MVIRKPAPTQGNCSVAGYGRQGAIGGGLPIKDDGIGERGWIHIPKAIRKPNVKSRLTASGGSVQLQRSLVWPPVTRIVTG